MFGAPTGSISTSYLNIFKDLINGQFIALMRTKDHIVLGALGKYIYEGFKKQDHLENNS